MTPPAQPLGLGFSSVSGTTVSDRLTTLCVSAKKTGRSFVAGYHTARGTGSRPGRRPPDTTEGQEYLTANTQPRAGLLSSCDSNHLAKLKSGDIGMGVYTLLYG